MRLELNFEGTHTCIHEINKKIEFIKLTQRVRKINCTPTNCHFVKYEFTLWV